MAEEEGPQPGLQQPQQQAPLPTGFASFDAASFFAVQQAQEAARAEALRAAADALLPTSSEEDDSEESEAEAEGLDGAGRAAEGRKVRGSGAAERRGGDGRRRRRGEVEREARKRRRRSRSRSRSKRVRGSSGAAAVARSDWAAAVEVERRKGPEARAAQVRSWASSETGLLKDPYYYDTRGDPANVAFQALYRADIPRYLRHDPSRLAALLRTLPRRAAPRAVRNPLPTEADGHRGGGGTARYHAPAAARRERSGRLRRWRKPPPPPDASRRRAVLPLGSYLPLDASQDGQLPPEPVHDVDRPATFYQVYVPAAQRQAAAAAAAAAVKQQEPAVEPAEPAPAAAPLEAESREEHVLRRTREFNAATRERPDDLQLWLDFAAFQDEAAHSGGARRGMHRAIAEKKVAILERALERHQVSDRLLLALLKAAEPLCDEQEMDRRWRRALALLPAAPRLWRAYIRRRAAAFGGFSARDLPRLHAQAAAALARQRARAGSPAAVAAMEAEAAALALDGARAALESGDVELGVAMLQVLLEYNLFAPEGWPAEALEVMFEDYWSSDAALVGEEGGAGWGAWLAGEPQARPESAARRAARQLEREAAAAAQAAQEGGEGGKAAAAAATGWEELAPAIRARFGHSLRFLEEEEEVKPAEDAAQEQRQQREEVQQMGAEQQEQGGERTSEEGSERGSQEQVAVEAEGQGEEPEPEGEEEEEEESEEALMQRLGLQLDEALAAAGEELPPPVLASWLASERRREAAAWEPRRLRPEEHAGGQSSGEEEEGEEEEGKEAAREGEEGSNGQLRRRRVAWRDVRQLLISFETEAAKQQLLFGALALLGAPLLLPFSAPSGGADEVWQAAAWVDAPQCSNDGVSCDGVSSVGGLPPPSWAAQVLAGGDWAWLHCSNISSGGGIAPGPALRECRWYREHPSRRAMLLRLLTALARGPCQAQPAVATALLDVASDTVPDEEQPQGERQRQQRRNWGAARELAKQLLASQRENLVLWQAYAELERRAGAAKAARRVYDACLAGAAATAPAAAAPLALSAACFELERGGGGAAGGLLGSAASASDSAAAAALRVLAWLGSSGAVPATAPPGAPAAGSSGGGGGGGGGPTLAPHELVAARRGFQDQLLALVQRQGRARQRGGAPLSPADAAAVSSAAAFEVLAGRLARGSLAAGVKAGLAVYDQALATLLPPPVQQQQQQHTGQQRQQEQCQERGAADPLLEQLCLQWCGLAAEAARAGLPAASPAAVRAALARALAAFPASPALLQLQAAHELAGHTVAALRRALLALAAGRPSAPAWLALLAVEVRTRAPASAVRAALERAVSSEPGRGCPLLWRLYLRWEAAGGRPEAVHRVFLRAVGACPGSKALWADGLALLNGAAPPKELTELLGVMRDKGLVLRTDPFEVLLEAVGGGTALASSGGRAAGGDSMQE